MKQSLKTFFKDLLKDKNGAYSLREIVIALFILIVIVSWIGRQFFHYDLPEFMFYSFVSLIGAGVFGYSIERKSIPPNK